MFKLGVGALLALSLVMMPLAAGAADLKVGVVDSADILGKSAQGKQIQDLLKRKSDELGRDLQKQDKEIGRMVEEFKKQAPIMKEEARKQRQAELSRRAGEFQRRVQDADKTMAKLEAKEKEPLLKKLQQAVNSVAQENKLDLVLDRRLSGLLYFNPSLDVTEKVRSRFGR